MGCSIAENEPLKLLRKELGIADQCHSLRTDCFHDLGRPRGDFALGIPGAALGYCQALFKKQGQSEENTQNILELLETIDAPWSKSHELFWGNKISESTEEFLSGSVKPLLGQGRMPVLITPLDPKENIGTIREIILCKPITFEGETTLVRVVLSNRKSVENIVQLMLEVLTESRASKKMPRYWFLLQATSEFVEWKYMAELMKDDFHFVNIAVNPFTVRLLPEFCWNMVTVAQIIVGGKDGIAENGSVTIPKGMKITGAKDGDSYNIYDFIKILQRCETSPTLILLGPSLPDWDNSYNSERLQKILPILKDACNYLWDGIKPQRRELVWNLSA